MICFVPFMNQWQEQLTTHEPADSVAVQSGLCATVDPKTIAIHSSWMWDLWKMLTEVVYPDTCLVVYPATRPHYYQELSTELNEGRSCSFGTKIGPSCLTTLFGVTKSCLKRAGVILPTKTATKLLLRTRGRGDQRCGAVWHVPKLWPRSLFGHRAVLTTQKMVFDLLYPLRTTSMTSCSCKSPVLFYTDCPLVAS